MVSLQELPVKCGASAMAGPKGKCPHGHSWSIHSPSKKGQRPYFWCRAVLFKRSVEGKKKKEKKRCMEKGRLTRMLTLAGEDCGADLPLLSDAHHLRSDPREFSVSHCCVRGIQGFPEVDLQLHGLVFWKDANRRSQQVVLVDESFLTKQGRLWRPHHYGPPHCHLRRCRDADQG